jgi:hypothetical protein
MTTMIGPLRRAVQVAPQRLAVRCGEVELTYDQMWERTRLPKSGAGKLLKRELRAAYWAGRETMVAVA